MLKNFPKTLLAVTLVWLLSGCSAQQKRPEFPIHDLNPPIQTGRYIQGVDNFLVLLDASDSMSGTYEGKQKFEIARETISHMNRTIPEINLLGGLRVYGNTPSGSECELIYGFTGYTMARTLEDALYEIPGPGGKTPMGIAIRKAADDLKSLKGKTALIIFSDGNVTDDPVAAVKAMKADLGENVCVYTVFIGDNAGGRQLMEEVALAGECGFAEKAENIRSATDMAGFVRKIFLTPVGPVSETEEVRLPPVLITSADTDGDGVLNDKDACPDTPRGLHVDERGCWVIENVLFHFNQTDILPEYISALEQLAEILKINPDFNVRLEGHTDSVGSAGYNQKLSEKRAGTVKTFLMKKGVGPERLETIGYGFSQPVAPNDSEEGRAQNRRVDLEPMRIK